ncbi:MAG: cytochrome c-type biogenesis protein [Pseudomonadota bacterium]
MTRLTLLLLFSLWSLDGAAVIETYEFSTPDLERRYQALSAELRCPKCQNQNIADSNAPISQDLRRLLHEQLEAGASDEEILEFMVARYGEFVRYRPEFSRATAILWLAPAVLLLLAVGVIVLLMRGRRKVAEAALTAEDEATLEKLLAQEPDRT